jgi:hypothetical protein
MRSDVHQVVPATEAHARALAPRLRAGDVAEIRATAGVGPLDGLLSSLSGTCAGGGQAWALLIGGEVAALWGVRPLTDLHHVGVVWLLTGDLVDRHRRIFMERSRAELRALLRPFAVLRNYIDARYSRALRWARWTGAELGQPRRFGVEARDFIPVTWRRGFDADARAWRPADGC